MKTTKLLILCHLSKLYGANKSLINLLQEINLHTSYSIHVLLRVNGPLEEKLKELQIPFTITPFPLNVIVNSSPVTKLPLVNRIYRYLRRCKKYIPVYRKLSVIIRAINPDVIYSNSSVIYWGAIWAYLNRKKHVWHIREMKEQYGIQHNFGISFFRFLLRKSHSIICNSHAVAENYAITHYSQTYIVYNGLYSIEELQQLYLSRKQKRQEIVNFCIVGGLDKTKGQLEALTAFSKLKSEFTNYRLYFAGDTGHNSAYKQKLESFVFSNSLSSHVIFKGYITDMTAFYQNMDVLICSSLHEAFGRVLVEALAHGVFVIARNTGGIPEIITHNRNGLLFNTDTELLETILIYLGMTDQQLETMHNNGFYTVKEKFLRNTYARAIKSHF